MVKLLNVSGLLIGFIGAMFAFLDSWRTGRFAGKGVKLGYKPKLKT